MASGSDENGDCCATAPHLQMGEASALSKKKGCAYYSLAGQAT